MNGSNASLHSGEPQPTLTRLAARRLSEIAHADLPADIQNKIGICLLDFLAACIGGLDAPWAPSILSYVASRKGPAEAYQWGLGVNVAVEDAAFGNGALGHSLIHDDMHVLSASHIGVLIIPAALALAQRDGWSGRALVRGLVGGYEMAMRLGVAVRSGTLNPHFRPSGINGPFGAAAAAIAATRADEETAMNALGFAANATAGVNEWPWAGGQEIYTHAGMAARSGIAAFDLARAGMRPSPTVLEGRDGLFNAYGAGTTGVESFRASLAKPLGLFEIHHKPFAGCNLIQSPIAAALAVAEKLAGRADEIETVTIRTFAQARAYPGCDNSGPFTHVQQSKMSLQFGVCSALRFNEVTEQTYLAFDDPLLSRLINATRIEIEPAFNASLMKLQQPATIEVRLRNGEQLSACLDDVPWLDDAAVIARFRQAASPHLPPTSIEKIIEITGQLWSMDDCTALFEAFATARSGQAAHAQ